MLAISACSKNVPRKCRWSECLSDANTNTTCAFSCDDLIWLPLINILPISPFSPLPRHAQVYPLFDFLRPWFMTASQSNCVGLHWAQHGFKDYLSINNQGAITTMIDPTRSQDGCCLCGEQNSLASAHTSLSPVKLYGHDLWQRPNHFVGSHWAQHGWLQGLPLHKNQRRWRLRLIPRDRKMGSACAGK